MRRKYLAGVLALTMALNIIHAPVLSQGQQQMPVISDVFVVGQSGIPMRQILSYTKEVTPGKEFDPKGVEADMKNILASGYFEQVEAQPVIAQDAYYIKYIVTEFPRVSSVSVEGSSVLAGEQVSKVMVNKPGEIFNMKQTEKDVEAINALAATQESFGTVSGIQISKEGTVHITITEPILEKIEIQGNTKTKEWIIRKMLEPIKVGSILTKKSLERAYLEMQDSRFFKEIKYATKPGADEKHVVLIVTVVEDKTGEWHLGGGYNTHDKGILRAGAKDRNRNGEGDEYGIEFGTSGVRTNYDVFYENKHLKGSDVSVLYHAGRSDEDVTTSSARYRVNRTSFGIQAWVPLNGSKEDKILYGFNHTSSKVRDVVGTTDAASNTTNIFTAGFIHDTRDSVQNTRSGERAMLSTEISSTAWGSDASFVKFIGEMRKFWAMSEKNVLAARFVLKFSPGSLPNVERFTVGGADTVRGLEEDAQRGNRAMVANVEYRHQMNKDIQFVTFLDYGGAWGDGSPRKLKIAEGIGFRLNTPMGTLRFDLAKTPGESSRFTFNFGNMF